MINFEPSDSIPAITYIQSVDKGSFADLAKLTAGDHIVEVSIDVSIAEHLEYAVIRIYSMMCRCY